MILLVQVRLYGPKQRIAHFHPNWSNGTAGVRGTRVLNGGRFYWEINVSQRIFGTSMMFGIGKNQGSFILSLILSSCRKPLLQPEPESIF